MGRYEEAAFKSRGVVRHVVGHNLSIGTTPVYHAIWPGNHTTLDRDNTIAGVKAELIEVHPIGGDVFMAINAVPTTGGADRVQFIADNEYKYPIHPDVLTLGFVSNSMVQAHVRQLIIR